MHKIDTADIELALSGWFHARKNFIIPNVFWGFRHLSYEIDLMVVTPAFVAYEVEIKVSASDLRRDAKKYKWNYCRSQHYFRKSYFAVPVDMLKYQDLVPVHAGILTVAWDDRRSWFDVTEVRAPVVDADAKKVTPEELTQLGRLCMLRMWDSKKVIRQRAWNEIPQQEAVKRE